VLEGYYNNEVISPGCYLQRSHRMHIIS